MTKSAFNAFERIMLSNLDQRRGQIFGEISPAHVSDLSGLLNYFAHGGPPAVRHFPVTISMFTTGGSLDASLALYDLIHFYRGFFSVEMVAMGACMSGGVIVLQAGTHRYAYPHTRFMVHELAYLGGTVSLTSQQREAEEAMRLHKIVREILLERSKVDLEKLRRAHGPVEHYITADGALKLGLVDGILVDFSSPTSNSESLGKE